jgi:hypothetical protein
MGLLNCIPNFWTQNTHLHVYGLMPLLPIEFIVPTNQIIVDKYEIWMNALLIQMEDLVLRDVKSIVARDNIDCIIYFKNIKKMMKNS